MSHLTSKYSHRRQSMCLETSEEFEGRLLIDTRDFVLLDRYPPRQRTADGRAVDSVIDVVMKSLIIIQPVRMNSVGAEQLA